MNALGARSPAKAAAPAAGFTLLEMAVVMGVIAILTLMALPSYLDRIVRKQIEASLPLAEVAKRPVVAAWALTQTMPVDNLEAGLPAADKIVGNYVSAVQVVRGAVHVTFGNSANGALKGKVLSLRPAVVEDAAIVPPAWVCGNAAVPAKMTAMGENRTSVPNAYLPLECAGRKQ
jgi:type IV pilus assembly protein PilA